MKRILFVCLGNICRSSSAEEVMRTLIKKEGLEHEIEVDSAGILSYHRGELPDSRMRMHASRRGYNLTHRSRPVCTEDFYHFDMIIGMDDRNIEDLMERAPDLETEKKIHRMTDYCRTKVADYVPDPYYGGAQGFENVLDILEDACAGLLTSLVPDTDTSMIHRFQLFFKQRFNCCYILERNRAFFEIPFRYLCVNNLIYQCADAFFRVLRQAA